MKKTLGFLVFTVMLLVTNVWSDQTVELGLGYSLSHIVVGDNKADVQSPEILSLMTFGKPFGFFLVADLNALHTLELKQIA